ncbi:sn-glycerol-3-phosphate ABC transporter ATP-binding protein UgpC [Ruficoccus sp. ZRK36]|uniref:ABC transporter ATP-binding protein n=1 Tax=Ruficoccus sp. ZRK36 TaxID=2866311 RepID=UPI002577E3DF|nr:sn-glycerol-3-phosphate ABC transporter ATP-binding protein UgpC [Ruficoccus sp. ZRK36]
MATVSICNLVKEYREARKPAFAAVKGIDLEIRDREFMVLVGPSGCGKSTTLRMVAGLEEITSGTIAIDGRIVNDVAPKDRDIAMVFQNYALYPHMSVYDNMAFGLKLRKLPTREIRQRVEEAADILGLGELLDRRPKALSGGQRQRVAVGRALVRKPKVFLFDEPLSNLDAKMRVQMRTEISRLHKRLEATMIYVTHDQTEAMTMGERICVMKDGNLMQVDTPLTLYKQPANTFVGGFIGSPPMNFFHGKVERQSDEISFIEDSPSASALKVKLPPRDSVEPSLHARSVVLGIRPEDIHVDTTGTSPIMMRIDVAEPMGAETYLYFNTGAAPFIARVHADHSFRAGEEIRLRFDTAKALLFDPASGDRLDEI